MTPIMYVWLITVEREAREKLQKKTLKPEDAC